MIKLEHVVLTSPEEMEFVIEGMRNPMNSWDKSDSKLPLMIDYNGSLVSKEFYLCGESDSEIKYENIRDSTGYLDIGNNDLALMQKLSNAGTDHRKFMRMMPVMVRITAPLYWWKEFDTYKVGTVANSCSTMHKITEKEFTLDDFSTDHLLTWTDKELRGVPELKYYQVPADVIETVIAALNYYREIYLKTKDKKYWYQLIQLLPSSYNQTRNVMLNYEVLANIYPSRKNHKLDEWVTFCKWIETLPYADIITGGAK